MADRLLDARPVAAQPVALAEAIADDYTDRWHGAGAYPGHSWAYDPRRQTWREQHQPPDEPAELQRQLAKREPALREWIRWFDTSGYLASNGLTNREISTLKALLRHDHAIPLATNSRR